jgi:hypothetical protein
MRLNVHQTLRGNHLALWATTYTFEPGFFDEFLFRQLGESPLNVNVLVDAHRIAKVWEEWADQPWRFRRVNRDYLVRSVRWGGHAFHPKTYLLADKRDGVLLVGSGNLGLGGLIEGKEVFCRFSSTTEIGRAAIGSWRAWMQRLVDKLGDDPLAHRWRELTRCAPWLALPPAMSPFVHNLDRPILDQLVEAIEEPVDELHVLAPFYDANVRAFAALLERTTPRKLVLYLPHGMSVSGERLADVLGAFRGGIQLLDFDDGAFVHAKLIGVVAGGEGLLLSGSPNCSGAALMSAGHSGNCEVAVLARTNTNTVRTAFVPPGWSVVERTVEDLLGLTFRSQAESDSRWPVTLTSAAKPADGRIEVKYEPLDGPPVAYLCTGNVTLPLAERLTVDPLPTASPVGVVWLSDPEGHRLSNAVPVDFPQQLQSWLAERSPGDDRPKELRPEDLGIGVGELLARLNRECIFDIDETTAVAGVLRGSDTNEGGEDEASDFWERFQADQLRRDYRIARYERLLASDGSTPWYVDDDVYGLLTAMLHQTPDHSLRRVGDSNGGQGASTQPVNPQLQKRVGNLLSRWSNALNDRRFRWISPKVPAKNYIALLGAIIECWAKDYVGGDRLTKITLTLLQSFVGSEKRRGYLLSLDEAERADAIQALGPDAQQVAAALVFTSLHPLTNWKAKVYEWQPVLITAVELGVLGAGPTTSRWLEELPSPKSKGVTTSDPKMVDDHLVLLATHTDDKHWSLVQADDLGFSKVAITSTLGAPARTYPITVKVEGVQDLVVEPRVVSLVRRALSYRQVQGLIVEGTSQGTRRPQRLSVVMGDLAYGTIGSVDWDSDRVLNRADLVALEDQGRGFEALLRREASALPMAG